VVAVRPATQYRQREINLAARDLSDWHHSGVRMIV
jgi:hypothetical protein